MIDLPPPPPVPGALRDRLAAAASAEGLLDVAVRDVDSPLGRLLVAATPQGVVRLVFAETEDEDRVLQQLADRIGPGVLRAPAPLDEAARQLDAYFTGRRHAFDLPLDLRLVTPFRRGVLEALTRVPYASTVTYAALARAAGADRAVRAVGTACATNPLPVVVPCHRVVRSDGGLGGYLGGTSAKRALLDLERATGGGGGAGAGGGGSGTTARSVG